MLELDPKRIFPRYTELKGDLRQQSKAVFLSQISPGIVLRPLERKHVEELKESIRALGLLQPLLVTPKPGGGMEILDGHHRYQALLELAQEAGQIPSQVPVPVVVLWTDNPNARYGLVVAAYHANRERYALGPLSLEEMGRVLEEALGIAKEVWREGVSLLLSLPPTLAEEVLRRILGVAPVEPLLEPGEAEGELPALLERLEGLGSGFRVAVYVVEALSDGAPLGFLRSAAQPQKAKPKEKGPEPVPFSLEGVALGRPTEVKKAVRALARSLLEEVRGLRLRSRELRPLEPKVREALGLLLMALEILRGLRGQEARRPEGEKTETESLLESLTSADVEELIRDEEEAMEYE